MMRWFGFFGVFEARLMRLKLASCLAISWATSVRYPAGWELVREMGQLFVEKAGKELEGCRFHVVLGLE